MKVAALVSGGKDSLYATYLASKENEIEYLITVSPESEESWMFHFPCVELTKLQAKAMGVKHIFRKVGGNELVEFKKIIEGIKDEIEGLVSGVIQSNYQKKMIEEICKSFDLKGIHPLWNRKQEEVVKEEIENGFEIIITGVSAEGLDESWLGKKLDLKNFEKLKEISRKYGINVAGEGGEFETFVLDCPLFKKKIEILEFKKFWDKRTRSGYLIAKDVRLISK